MNIINAKVNWFVTLSQTARPFLTNFGVEKDGNLESIIDYFLRADRSSGEKLVLT